MKRYILAQTFTMMQSSDDKYYCCLEVDKTGLYTVQVCPKYSDGLCGYPVKDYTTTDEIKAKRTFKRYTKEYGLIEET